jgi:hypothetical protein
MIPSTDLELVEGKSFPLGATCRADGVNFSLYSKNASSVELLLFDGADDRHPARTIALDHAVHRTGYWEPLSFEFSPTEQGAGWRRWLDTSLPSPDDICELDEAPFITGATYVVRPRSIACLFSRLGA